MIQNIYIYKNGMTMVFDDKGEQFSKCQGFLFSRRVSDNIRKYADKNTRFYFADWEYKTREKCNFKWFFKRQKEFK